MKPIWIVDDDQSIRFVLEKALLREGLSTRSFTNPKEVLAALNAEDGREVPQVLVSDIRMPGGSGLDLLTEVKQKLPGLPVIIMTAFSDLDSAVSAFQNGAFEYLPKPFDLPKAIELIRRALEESQREEVAEELMASTPEMLGQAPAMQDVFRAIGRLSQSNVTVMITGESGSGKELVARWVHERSTRASMPLVEVNCASIPSELIESELGEYSYVSQFSIVNKTIIGKFCSIANNVSIGLWHHDTDVTTHTFHLYETSGGFVKGFTNFKKDNIQTTIGNDVWIGEEVWIDNLAKVQIGNNVCISQGAMLLCGNHNFSKSNFDLITGTIILEDGVWIGAKSIVGPNVVCHSHSVLGVSSVASKDLEAYSIYRGNPALLIKERNIE